jgi:Tol biopolymer transport system component
MATELEHDLARYCAWIEEQTGLSLHRDGSPAEMDELPRDAQHDDDRAAGPPRWQWWLVAAAVVGALALGVLALAGDGDPDRVQTATVPETTMSASLPVTTMPRGIAATTPSVPSQAPSTSRAAVCGDNEPLPWVAAGSFPADGPDSRGRIFFGQLAPLSVRPEVLGQSIGRLFAIDPDGTDVAQLLDCKIQRPRVSPDGARLAFAVVMDDETLQVATANVDGSGLRILTSTSGFAETPDWSPDGSWLVYSVASQPCPTGSWEACVVDGGMRYSLWRMDADGGNQQLIGESDTVDLEPRIAPGGRQVVFTRVDPEPGLPARLVIRDLDTGRERQRVVADHDLIYPDWSPDGEWIVYNAICGRNCGRIERVPADDLEADSDVLYSDDQGQRGEKAVYAPDGSQIVFGCESRLCVMNADGSDPQVLVNISGLNHFDWGQSAGADADLAGDRPDSTRIDQSSPAKTVLPSDR